MKKLLLALVFVALKAFSADVTPPNTTKPQPPNTTIMGPTSGAAAVSSYRVPVAADWTAWNLDLSASKLTSGTVPLSRLSGITNTEISASAAILGTKVSPDFGTQYIASKVLNDTLANNRLFYGQNTAGFEVVRLSADPDGSGKGYINVSNFNQSTYVILQGSGSITASGNIQSVSGQFFGSGAGITGVPVSTGISGLGTGVATALATNVGGAGAVVLFNGAAGTPSSLSLANATGLTVAGGGTGLTGGSTNALLYFSNASTLATIAAGSTGNFLKANGVGAPAFSSVDLANTTNVTGTLPVANGGTGIATTTPYSVICAGSTATGNFQSLASLGTSGQFLTSNGAGALPTWQTAGGSVAFSGISSGTNTTAAMVVGAGGTLGTSTTGTIQATSAVTVAPAVAGTSTAGTTLTITASAATAGNVTPGAAAGGNINITTGAAARLTSGNADGGTLTLILGIGTGTGKTGGVNVTAGGTTVFGLPQMKSPASYSGINNCLAGTAAGQSLTSGARTTCFGVNAMPLTTSNSDNTAIGYNALAVSDSSACTAVGSQALLTANGSGVNNAAFGYKAGSNITSGNDNTFIGTNAAQLSTSTSSNNVAVGSNTMSANANYQNNTIVGTTILTGASASNSVVIGYSAQAQTATSQTVIGTQAQAGSGAGGNTIIGFQAGLTNQNNSSQTGVILIGSGADVPTNLIANVFIAGSGSFPATDLYFGKGMTHATPTNYTLNGTGGSGSNIAGANITVAGGKGTGSGAPGEIIFSTTTAAGSSSTLQTLAERVRINAAGSILMTGSSSGTFTISLASATAQAVTLNVAAQTTGSATVTIPDMAGTSRSMAFNEVSFSAQTATYTAVLADVGKLVTMTLTGTANNFQIPTDGTTNFPIGTQITVVQMGTGVTTIVAVTPGTTTVNSTGATPASPVLRARYSSATCIKTATNVWLVIGDIL